MGGAERSCIVPDFYFEGEVEESKSSFSNDQKISSPYRTHWLHITSCTTSSPGAFYWTIPCSCPCEHVNIYVQEEHRVKWVISCLFLLEILFWNLKMVIRTSNAKFPQRSQDSLKWEGVCSSAGELVHREERAFSASECLLLSQRRPSLAWSLSWNEFGDGGLSKLPIS